MPVFRRLFEEVHVTHYSILKRGRGAPRLKLPIVLLAACWFAPLATVSAYVLPGTTQLESWMQAPNDFVEQLQASRINKLIGYLQEKFQIPDSKAELIVKAAIENGLDKGVQPEVILAVIAVESTFREEVVSHMGARGLMQVMPRYHPQKVKKIGGANRLFDPKLNIFVGVWILEQYLDLSKGDLRQALLRYNGSLGNPKSRYADKVFRVYEDIKSFSPAPDSLVARLERG